MYGRTSALEHDARHADGCNEHSVHWWFRALDGLALLVLTVEPFIEVRLAGGAVRDDGNHAATIGQVLICLGNVLDGRLAAVSEWRIHGDTLEFVVDIEFHEITVEELCIRRYHLRLRCQLAGRLHYRIDGIAAAPAGNSTMASRRFEEAVTDFLPQPLHHLHPDRLRRSKIIHALGGLVAARLFAARVVESLGTVPVG